MKINKNITIVCSVVILIGTIVLSIGIVFYKQFFDRVGIESIITSIFIGIITGLIVSTVMAFIGYFHERAIIIGKIDFNIKSLFINMVVLSKMLEAILPQIHPTTDLSILPFKNISGLSALNLDFVEKMELHMFNAFFPNGKFSKIDSQLIEFDQTIYNIKSISMNLEIKVLEYQNLYLQIQKIQLIGMQPNFIDLQNLDNLKNYINIRTAKFHEYITGKTIELEKIAESFYKNKNISWRDIKSNLLTQAENILKQDI